MLLGHDYGSISLFFLMMSVLSDCVPDETLLVFSGFLIYKGTLDPVFTFACLPRSVSGITVSYFLDESTAQVIHKYGRYFHLTEERYQKVHNWFEESGRWSLFFGYYIAGVRHFTHGRRASDLEYPRFAVFALLRRLHLGVVFPFHRYFVGDSWESASKQLHTICWKSACASAALRYTCWSVGS